jgi:hypothetical protein
MVVQHSHKCRVSTRITALLAFIFILGFSLFACGISSNAEASFYRERTIESPDLQGWEIAARNSGMCSARQREENGQSLTLLADPGKYRGGVWFLDVVSRNQRLKPGVLEAEAYLSLNGKRVITGKVLDIGDWHGEKRIATYVRFEFPAIDPYIKDVEAAREVEAQADGLSPLKLESLSPIIAALKNCQRESSNPEFWKNAK